MKLTTLIASAVAVLAVASGCLHMATAATITEYNRATFQAALASDALNGQNFDSLPLGTITTVNGVTYTPSLGTAVVTDSYLTTTPPNGLGSTSVGYFEANETLTIIFSTPITAFAIDINTYASRNGDYKGVVNDGSSSVIPSVFDVFPNTETGEFLGFTDSAPFTSIVISNVADLGTGNGSCNSNGTCSYTVDTLAYGNASAVSGVPEPATFGMAGLGLAIGVLSLRKRAARKS